MAACSQSQPLPSPGCPSGVRMRRTEAELLTNARNTIEMAIAGPDVTGRRGIPVPREKILLHRTLVQKHLTRPVHDQQMHRPVAEFAPVHFASCELTGHPVLLVHHIKKLVKVLAHAGHQTSRPD